MARPERTPWHKGWLNADGLLVRLSIIGAVIAMIVAAPALPTVATIIGVPAKEEVYTKQQIDGFRSARDGAMDVLVQSIHRVEDVLGTLGTKIDRLCTEMKGVQIDNLTARLSSMRRDQLALDKNSDAISLAIKADLITEITIQAKKLELIQTDPASGIRSCAS